MNIGEEICGEWLRHIRKCEFIQYNLRTPDVQGEIDVIGINLAEKIVYICEVAIHLITGLQYVKNSKPDNVPRLTAKFRKDITFIKKSFPDYKHVFMLWSPVVKNSGEHAINSQIKDIKHIIDSINKELSEVIEPVINETFNDALRSLRGIAGKETKELDSSVMRFLQIEEHLAKHIHLNK